MSLLFSDVVKKYNSEREKQLSDNELTNKVADFLDSVDDDNCVGYNLDVTEQRITPQITFISTVANEYYAKAQDDIANTAVGNKSVRKKNFRQVMQESFFYGSNRFGNNFIA